MTVTCGEPRICALAKLPDGWDSYGAPRITAKALMYAEHLLELLATAAQVVPCSDGGIQLEWHSLSADVELKIAPDGTLEMDV